VPDVGPKVTAVGGVQWIAIDPPVPFSAEVDGLSFDVSRSWPPSRVAIRGAREGTSELRLEEPFIGALYDRISLSVRTMASLELWPLGIGSALLAGSGVRCVVRLYASDAALRLVDEGIHLSSTTTISVTPTNEWDVVEVRASRAGTGSVQVTMSDGETRTVQVEVVASVESIAAPGLAASSALKVGDNPVVCFDALSQGRHVAGALWSFSASASLSATPLSGLDAPNCVMLRSSTPGVATLSVDASGLEQDFEIQVVAR
jgi:hypothetical protein